MTLLCAGGCGRPYSKGPDLVVSDKDWARIAPGLDGGGVLCPNCMHDRFVATGAADGSIPARFASGPFASLVGVQRPEDVARRGLIDRLRSGPDAHDYSLRLRKYQELCDEAAAVLALPHTGQAQEGGRDRSNACPTCGFRIVKKARPPFVIEDDAAPASPRAEGLPPIDETLHPPDVVESLQHRALAPAPQAGCAKEGWKLVPIEPTKEMFIAARDWSAKEYGKPIGNAGANGCYRAMLAASPLPPVAESGWREIETASKWLAENFSDEGSWWNERAKDACIHLDRLLSDRPTIVAEKREKS